MKVEKIIKKLNSLHCTERRKLIEKENLDKRIYLSYEAIKNEILISLIAAEVGPASAIRLAFHSEDANYWRVTTLRKTKTNKIVGYVVFADGIPVNFETAVIFNILTPEEVKEASKKMALLGREAAVHGHAAAAELAKRLFHKK